MIKWFMRRYLNKVQISEVSQVRWNGEWWEVVSIVTYGASYGHRSAYVLSRKHDLFEIWIDDATAVAYRKTWVDADSLAGIMSLVEFDINKLRQWKDMQRG